MFSIKFKTFPLGSIWGLKRTLYSLIEFTVLLSLIPQFPSGKCEKPEQVLPLNTEESANRHFNWNTTFSPKAKLSDGETGSFLGLKYLLRYCLGAGTSPRSPSPENRTDRSCCAGTFHKEGRARHKPKIQGMFWTLLRALRAMKWWCDKWGRGNRWSGKV